MDKRIFAKGVSFLFSVVEIKGKPLRKGGAKMILAKKWIKDLTKEKKPPA